MRALIDATRGLPTLLTIAPERPGAIEAIRLAVAAGIRVSLGHTNAPLALLREAVAAGASGLTHLGNACPQTWDRHDNSVWRALEIDSFAVGLIPDGIHVSPALFRIFHRLLSSKRIYYTTDAMAAAGAPSGVYHLGELALEVGIDRVVRQPGRDHFAGSALSPFAGILRASEMLGTSWRAVWPRFSTQPAAVMGFRSGLETGCPADFCLIDDVEGQSPKLQSVVIGGEQGKNRRRLGSADTPKGQGRLSLVFMFQNVDLA